MAFHVVVALIGTVALLNASEKMSGFNAGVIYLLFSLGSFYVFFGLVAIYAVYKTRGFALRDVASNYDYNKDSDRRTFWIMHRELFPPDWR